MRNMEQDPHYYLLDRIYVHEKKEYSIDENKTMGRAVDIIYHTQSNEYETIASIDGLSENSIPLVRREIITLLQFIDAKLKERKINE